VAPHNTADRFVYAFDNAVFQQSLFRVFGTAGPKPAASRQKIPAALLIDRDSGYEYVDNDQTQSVFLPFLRRRFNVFLPSFVFIFARKPCERLPTMLERVLRCFFILRDAPVV
jgi:hypothetical protein